MVPQRRHLHSEPMHATQPLPIELVDAFGVGVYVLMLITHANLWLHRRDRPSHFWLATSSLGALLVNVTGAVGRADPVAAQNWITALNLFGVALALVSLYELAQSITHRRSGTTVRRMQFVTALPAVLTLVFGNTGFDAVLYIMSIFFFIAAMMRALQSARTGDPESRMLAIGLITLFLTLIYDMLSELHLIARIDGVPVLGFTVLFIAAARALSLRYEREHRELVGLRGDLELRVQQRTTELEAVNRRLDELSRTDTLTGLGNRRSFIATASNRLQKESAALLMIDIDHFKQINDTHGHDVGDVALRAFADALRRPTNERVTVARWGGEEFIALLPEQDGTATAESLRLTIEQIVLHAHGTDVPVTASFGLAICALGSDLNERIAAADRALYQAKQQGRNRVVVATD